MRSAIIPPTTVRRASHLGHCHLLLLLAWDRVHGLFLSDSYTLSGKESRQLIFVESWRFKC